ncbi:MAG: hypothetical protein WD271_15260 [Acidimicrobiia bacterium]
MGRALFLVVPSSAGKTSLGHALLNVLPDPYLFVEVDQWALHWPLDRPEFATLAHQDRLDRGAALALRGYLDAGVDLIVEWGLWHARARVMAARVFAPYDAWLIGLRWDLETLETREAARTDGILAGTARGQATRRGVWELPCDLELDAVHEAPDRLAERVTTWLSTAPEPRAIRSLAASQVTVPGSVDQPRVAL